MRTLVDTNILLYAMNADAPRHPQAAAYLHGLIESGESWCLSWVNVYEFLALATHPGILARPADAGTAWEWLSLLLKSPALEMLSEGERHASALSEVLADSGPARGAFLHDCHLAALMREHEVKAVATADADFRKFRFLKVMDPTRG